MAYETIIYDKKDGVGIITLNRPEKKNALSPKLMREVDQAFREAGLDPEVRVVIITGNPECFSSGADLREVPQAGPEVMAEIRGVFDRIEAFGKPTIAAISGHCLAGGLELAAACDMRVVSETAGIGDRHIQIGVVGGGGILGRLPRIVGLAKAKEMVFTGDPVDGNEAYRIGLANKVYPKDQYLEGAMELARRIATFPPAILKAAKVGLQGGISTGIPEAVQLNNVISDLLAASAEGREGIGAFLEKREAKF